MNLIRIALFCLLIPKISTAAPDSDALTDTALDHGPDTDGDGWPDDVDCQDGDATIYPNADEVCDDNLDNDCDELVDRKDSDCKILPCGGNRSFILPFVVGVFSIPLRRRRTREVDPSIPWQSHEQLL
ncbi:MAG: MopE-related protein [Myxococcota bacterium]|nr:MopE-related protein [Myxococcota bacterium]